MASEDVPAKTAGRVRKMGRVEKGIRVGLYFPLLIGYSLFIELLLQVWALGWSKIRPAGYKHRFNVLKRAWGAGLCELTLQLLRTELEVVGEIPPGRFVIVSNHQSTADIAILFWVFYDKNIKYVAKRELAKGVPTVSTSLSKGGAALIDREPSREDLKRLKVMARGLEAWDGTTVVFVEGTRSRDGYLLPYRSAGLRICAKESGLPILPVCIDGTHVASDLPGFARDMPGSKGAVYVGDPISPEEYAGRIDEVLEEIRAWTEETMEEGRASGRVLPPPPRPADGEPRE
jgi:1-acyl-sn-glycerol-3-phosphate acyltransferase